MTSRTIVNHQYIRPVTCPPLRRFSNDHCTVECLGPKWQHTQVYSLRDTRLFALCHEAIVVLFATAAGGEICGILTVVIVHGIAVYGLRCKSFCVNIQE